MESTYGIGEMARRTGLTVSALRFYDREGVLVPAQVAPRSGYRCYTGDQVGAGRLVARLRRVGLPLADVRHVLAHRHEPAVVRAVLDAHLSRLEHGLALARQELSAVLHDLDEGGPTVTPTFTLPAADLAAALRGVRFAVGDDPSTPQLHGILLDLRGDSLRVVATDRYRLAVRTAPVVRAGDDAADVSAAVPVAFADDLLAACTGTARTAGTAGTASTAGTAGTPSTAGAALSLGAQITATVGGRTLTSPPLDGPFPQWELLAEPATPHRLTLDATAFRDSALSAATSRQPDGIDEDVCVFRVYGDGLVWLCPPDVGDGVAVNRDYLLEALEALAGDRLVLGLDGPHTPLAFSSPDRPGAVSLLMPVRLP